MHTIIATTVAYFTSTSTGRICRHVTTLRHRPRPGNYSRCLGLPLTDTRSEHAEGFCIGSALRYESSSAVTRIDDMLEVTKQSVSSGSAGRDQCPPVVLLDALLKSVLDETMGQQVETQRNLHPSVLPEGWKRRRKFKNPASISRTSGSTLAGKVSWQVRWLNSLRKLKDVSMEPKDFHFHDFCHKFFKNQRRGRAGDVQLETSGSSRWTRRW